MNKHLNNWFDKAEGRSKNSSNNAIKKEFKRQSYNKNSKKLYSELYYDREIIVRNKNVAEGVAIEVSVELLDFNGNPDCKIGHFGYNFWFRTPYGIKAKKYSSPKRLELAVEKVLKRNGFEIIGWHDNSNNL